MLTNERIKNEETFNNFSRIDQELIKRLGVAVNKLIGLNEKHRGLVSDLTEVYEDLNNANLHINRKYGFCLIDNNNKLTTTLDYDKLKTLDGERLLEMHKVTRAISLIIENVKISTDNLAKGYSDLQKNMYSNTDSLNTPERVIPDFSLKGHSASIKSQDDASYLNFKKVQDTVQRDLEKIEGAMGTLFRSNIISSESKRDIVNFLQKTQENNSRINLIFRELNKTHDMSISCDKKINEIKATIEKKGIDAEEAIKLWVSLYNEPKVGRGYKL